jgi:hypothetical protein
MATTTNYSWTTPDDTALVKDGAAAIRSLGTSIDTTTKNLNPSTTLGDIEYRSSTANTNTRLGIGSTGNVLTVAGGVPTWAAPSGGGGANWSLLNAGGTALTGASTITVSGISAKDKIMVFLTGASADANSNINMRFNADSGANYNMYGLAYTWATSYASSNYGSSTFNSNEIYLGNLGTSGSDTFSGYLRMDGCNASGVKIWQTLHGTNGNSVSQTNRLTGGWYNSSSTISSVSLISMSGNFDGGTIFVYTSAT